MPRKPGALGLRWKALTSRDKARQRSLNSSSVGGANPIAIVRTRSQTTEPVTTHPSSTRSTPGTAFNACPSRGPT